MVMSPFKMQWFAILVANLMEYVSWHGNKHSPGILECPTPCYNYHIMQ